MGVISPFEKTQDKLLHGVGEGYGNYIATDIIEAKPQKRNWYISTYHRAPLILQFFF